MLCSIPAAVNAQNKPVVHPILQDDLSIARLPPINKSGCPTACPAGMSCDGACCMYPTQETIGSLNYIIYNKCEAIKDLHFRFEVSKEWTAEYDEWTNNCNASQLTKKLNSTEGIVIQFNHFSPYSICGGDARQGQPRLAGRPVRPHSRQSQ